MRAGIVGHAADKFTPETEKKARAIIREILSPPDVIGVSGGCHLGGVDIWAEEEAAFLGREFTVYAPTVKSWSAQGGYKDRNLSIAKKSDEVHVIVVATYPEGFTGEKYGNGECYHCLGQRPQHVKSGACWTAMMHESGGGRAYWHII